MIMADESPALQGTVVGHNGEALKGMRVGIATSDVQDIADLGRNVYATALSNEYGTFTLPQIDGNAVVVLYTGDNNQILKTSSVMVSREEHSVRVVMSAERMLVIVVKDATSGAVIDGARIGYQAHSSSDISHTFGGSEVANADGTLSIPIRDESIDNLNITAAAPGYQPVQPTVTAITTAQTAVEVSLLRSVDSIEALGSVLDADGKPAAVPLRILRSVLPDNQQYEIIWRGHSGPDGTFSCLLASGPDGASILFQAGILTDGAEGTPSLMDARASALRRPLKECQGSPTVLVLGRSALLDITVIGQPGMALDGARIVIDLETVGHVPFRQMFFGSTLTRTAQEGSWRGLVSVPAGAQCHVWCAHDTIETGRITSAAEIDDATDSAVQLQVNGVDNAYVTVPPLPRDIKGVVHIALLQQAGRGPNYFGAGDPGQVVTLNSVSLGEYELVAYVSDDGSHRGSTLVIKQMHVRVPGLGGSVVLDHL
jgi:hypothetical protein